VFTSAITVTALSKGEGAHNLNLLLVANNVHSPSPTPICSSAGGKWKIHKEN